jgi:hypothetical protein
MDTRDKIFDAILAKYGFDPRLGPPPSGATIAPRVTIKHKQPIGSNIIGNRGTRHKSQVKPLPSGKVEQYFPPTPGAPTPPGVLNSHGRLSEATHNAREFTQSGNPQQKWLYPDNINGGGTQYTTSTLKWDGSAGRWKLVSHFPEATIKHVQVSGSWVVQPNPTITPSNLYVVP